MKPLRVRIPPFLADGLLALVVFVLAVTVPADGPDGLAVAEGTASFLLIGLGSAGLVLRRPYPIPVWLTALSAATVGTLIAGSVSPTLLPGLVALYTVAARGPRNRAVAAALITGLCLIGALAAPGVDGVIGPGTYLVLGWSGMATALGVAVHNQRAVVAAAVERAQRAEESREREAQRRVTQERLRIAQDLHDVVAHHVSVVTLQSGVALHLLDTRPAKAREAMTNVRDAGREVLAEMKTLLGLLRTPEEPTQIQPAPGLDRIEELFQSWQGAGLQVVWRTTGPVVSLSPLVDLTAYRLVQEALTNAAKHGNGSVEVQITYSESWTTIKVSNGMRTPFVNRNAAAPEEGTGRGLLGMRERVATVGGRVSAGFDDQNRFIVHAELPTTTGSAATVDNSGSVPS